MTVNHMIDILQFIYRGGSSPSPRANYNVIGIDY